MHRRACFVLLFPAFISCSSGDDGRTGGGEDSGLLPSGVPDSAAFTFADDASAEAGPLLRACDPQSAGSCPTGFTCFAEHTSASWWVDLYGTCTFACTSLTLALCDSLDGVCGCPVPPSASAGNCSDDGGTPLLCVPALKPGATPGASDGDGGCGSPGCGGGPEFEAGEPAEDNAGD